MRAYSYILEQQGKTTSEKLAAFTTAIGWRDELATYRIVQDEYEMRAAAAAEQGISLLDEPPYTAEELAALDAESAAYYNAFAANYVATAAFSGTGSGTQSDPYIITNRAELESIADDLTAYYRLANDIDLGSSQWTAIGTSSAPFSGTLDGDGCRIQNLVQNTGYIGIFYFAHGASVLRLGVTNIDLTPTESVTQGPIISYAVGCDISQCYVTGTIVSTIPVGCGGIVGVFTQSSRLSDCWTDIDISGNGNRLAGSVAYVEGGQISNVYTLGSISGASSSSYAGGVGGIYRTEMTIQTSVALQSSIAGGDNVNRIYGGVLTGGTATLQNNYANAAMLVNGNTVSGGTTSNENGADVSPSTYHTQAFWQNTLGWDFQNVWYWDDTEQLPKLRAFLHGPTISSVSATPTTGGTTTQITLSATDGNSYQWQYSTNGGSSWQNIPGATAIIATWTPGVVGTYQVRLLATNSSGTTISDTVTVTIYPDPTISEVSIYPNPSDESATFLMSVTVNES